MSFPLQGLVLPLAATAVAATVTGTYDCVAISGHYVGHYATLAQRGASNSWFFFNDSRVSAIPWSMNINVENPHAYLLFYVRRAGVPARSSFLEFESHSLAPLAYEAYNKARQQLWK